MVLPIFESCWPHLFDQPNEPSVRYSFGQSSGSHASIYFVYPLTASISYNSNVAYKSFNGKYNGKEIKIFGKPNEGLKKQEFIHFEYGQLAQETFDTFFKWTKGTVDELSILFRFHQNENEEEALKHIEKILAGRPIRCQMFRHLISDSHELNHAFPKFFRNYVDFKMFGTAGSAASYMEPFLICEKLVNCEFLYLDTALVNSDVLRDDFKGWGLVLRQPDPNFDFKYISGVFEKWYEFEDIQWKYLCLPCDICYYDCKDLIDIGKIVEIERGEEGNKKQLTELQVSRDIGEFCRFGRLPLEKYHGWESKKSLVYFYIGECCDEMFKFNLNGNELRFKS